MQNITSLSSVKVLIVMSPSDTRNNLVKNVQKHGFKPEISTNLPELLNKLNNSDRYDVMVISLTSDINHAELIPFMRSGLSGKCPHLVGVTAGLSEVQQRIYSRYGGVNECINSIEDFSKIAKLFEKVHKTKFTKKIPAMPKNLVVA